MSDPNEDISNRVERLEKEVWSVLSDMDKRIKALESLAGDGSIETSHIRVNPGTPSLPELTSRVECLEKLIKGS